MQSKRVNKKGQAAAAAALLAIVAALIVLYILFIPPEDRAEILGQDFDDDGVRRFSNRSTKNITILEENPGRIDFLSQKRIDHAIPNTHLFTRTAGLVLEQKPAISVSRSIFSSVESDFSFDIADLQNTKNVLLSFNIARAKGQLMIFLNGEQIFSKEITTPNVDPITLPARSLKATNTITLQTSSPGLAFWRTNDYQIENIQVTGDVTRTESQRSKSVFLVSQVEFNNLDSAKLRFQADCDIDFAGPLDIWVNEFNVYSAVPDCGIGRLSMEFPATYLNSGQNDLTMSINRGDYLISLIAIESKLKQIDFPVYFFELSEEQYRSVKNGTKRLVTKIDFIDTIDRKHGEIIINGHISSFDTKDLIIEEDISADIERGNNGIKIRPERTLYIRQLQVSLVPR
jgi:hypothetical protein